jgi:hypothetical protein
MTNQTSTQKSKSFKSKKEFEKFLKEEYFSDKFDKLCSLAEKSYTAFVELIEKLKILKSYENEKLFTERAKKLLDRFNSFIERNELVSDEVEFYSHNKVMPYVEKLMQNISFVDRIVSEESLDSKELKVWAYKLFTFNYLLKMLGFNRLIARYVSSGAVITENLVSEIKEKINIAVSMIRFKDNKFVKIYNKIIELERVLLEKLENDVPLYLSGLSAMLKWKILGNLDKELVSLWFLPVNPLLKICLVGDEFKVIKPSNQELRRVAKEPVWLDETDIDKIKVSKNTNIPKVSDEELESEFGKIDMEQLLVETNISKDAKVWVVRKDMDDVLRNNMKFINLSYFDFILVEPDVSQETIELLKSRHKNVRIVDRKIMINKNINRNKRKVTKSNDVTWKLVMKEEVRDVS